MSLITLLKTHLKKIITGTLALLLVVGAGVYIWRITRQPDPQKETRQIVELVSDLMILPTAETPTLATVSEKELLMEQPFFQRAENGDKVLMYLEAKKAILYRPSVHKIIDVTTINIDNKELLTNSPGATSAKTVEKETTSTTDSTKLSTIDVEQVTSRTVTLLNGTASEGLATQYQSLLSTSVPTIQIIRTGNAISNNYPDTIVVDATKQNAVLAQQIAKTIGGTVKDLPSGELVPKTDLLVILGQDKVGKSKSSQ